MKRLKNLSFAISILGIFLLLFISNIEIKKTNSISEINYKMLNKRVKIEGEIMKIKEVNENFQIISLVEKENKIDILTNKRLNLKNGDLIEVTGTVSEYNKTLQIQSEKIVMIEKKGE